MKPGTSCSETGTIPKINTTQQEKTEVFPEVVLEEHNFTDDEEDSFVSVDICTTMKRHDAATSDISDGEDGGERKHESKAKKQDELEGKGYQKQ